MPAFDNPELHARHDGARLDVGGARLAFTTDSYVVRPLFFPGGDIGTLAVNGTVNDLAMCGARPLFLSAGFILEEGLPMESLLAHRRVDARRRARQPACSIVTGDTKVVDRGKGDGVFINTAGIGVIEHDGMIAPASVRPGDAVLLIGRYRPPRHRHHGGARGAGVRDRHRQRLRAVGGAGPGAARRRRRRPLPARPDARRPGQRAGRDRGIDRPSHPDRRATPFPSAKTCRGACEILGLDPLYVANEGRFVAFVAPKRKPAAHWTSCGVTRSAAMPSRSEACRNAGADW